MLPTDLPGDLPSFLERFGADAQCRAYLFRARWPDGFRCTGCGRQRAWAHKARLIYECAACGKQHSLLAGTMFEQTKTGLARWFLAIFLVTQGAPAAHQPGRADQARKPALAALSRRRRAARAGSGAGRPLSWW